MTNFLDKHGKRLLDLGYPIIPIKAGLKHPGFGGWQNTAADDADLSDWLSRGFKGVGILTAQTPAVDLDILDETIVDQMVAFVSKMFPDAPRRTGQAPKTLFVCRTDEPFTKIQSAAYEDFLGNVHRVEILGQGQQFVAFHTHPDTKKPYTWHGTPLDDIAYDDLPTITRDDAHDIVAYFESIIPDDWEVVEREQKARDPLPDNTPSDLRALAYASPPLDLTDDQVATCLKVLSDRCDSYSEWIKVGMALYHQYNGSQQGFTLWNDWSVNSVKYRGNEMAAKWRTFKTNLSTTRPTTFATVLKWAKEARKKQKSIADDSNLFMHISDLTQQLGPTKWQIEGFLEQDATGVLFGPPGAFKSFLALDWALCTASGRDWNGHPVEQGTAIYVAGEGFNGLAKRVVAWGIRHNVDLKALPFYLTKKPIRLRDEDCAKDLREHIEKLTKGGDPARLIVIDTVARNFGPGDENSTSDMGDFVNRIDSEIRAPLGATVMPIHHTGHSNKDRMRGSNALEGAADFLFRLDKQDNNVNAVLTNTRQKNDELSPQMWFEAQSIMIGGFDTDITSLVLSKTDAPETSEAKEEDEAKRAEKNATANTVADYIERDFPNEARLTPITKDPQAQVTLGVGQTTLRDRILSLFEWGAEYTCDDGRTIVRRTQRKGGQDHYFFTLSNGNIGITP